MNDPAYNPLLESSWRRKLTAAEEARLQAWLAAHPEARAGWNAESGLNRLLEGLPEAPAVSSNFTSLVLQAVERDAASEARAVRRGWKFWPALHWLPRTAVAVAAVGLGLVFYQRHLENNRVAMARSITEVSGVMAASNPEAVENFDAIRWLGDLQPKADTDLYALME